MKKGYGLARVVPIIERSELDKLPTGALLARLKRLRWCEDSAKYSDLMEHEITSAAGQILFKDDPRWKAAYADVKSILATRENIDRKIG